MVVLEVQRERDEARRLVAEEQVVGRELDAPQTPLVARVEATATAAGKRKDGLRRRRPGRRRVVQRDRAARDPDARQLGRQHVAELPDLARRHEPLAEDADDLVALLADQVLERALLIGHLVQEELDLEEEI